MIKFSTPILLSMVLIATNSLAKDWQIQMLNYGDSGSMVFEPDYIHANVGDTVTFIPTQSGHNAKSYIVPEGSSAWSSKLNQEHTLSLENEGVHVYYCPPHLMMGMVGVIQVGNAKNLEKVSSKYPRLRSKVALQPERVDTTIAKIR